MVDTRRATLTDLPAITAIYNDAVLKTTATFDTTPKTDAEQREWFEHHDDNHPVLVAVEQSTVVGWASLSAWSDRCAYASTAEVSIYIHEEWRGNGVGRTLMAALVAEGERLGLHTLIARIAEGNPASIRLHTSAGFTEAGILKEVGEKFGRLLDVAMLQKIYPKK